MLEGRVDRSQQCRALGNTRVLATSLTASLALALALLGGAAFAQTPSDDDPFAAYDRGYGAPNKGKPQTKPARAAPAASAGQRDRGLITNPQFETQKTGRLATKPRAAEATPRPRVSRLKLVRQWNSDPSDNGLVVFCQYDDLSIVPRTVGFCEHSIERRLD